MITSTQGRDGLQQLRTWLHNSHKTAPGVIDEVLIVLRSGRDPCLQLRDALRKFHMLRSRQWRLVSQDAENPLDVEWPRTKGELHVNRWFDGL